MAEKEKETVWTRNFADDKQLAERVAGIFVPRIRVTRNNRLPLEEAWWRFFNQWNVTKDGYHTYTGRAQLYIPEVRKNVEAQARQLTKSAFPGDDCFDVSPGLTGSRKGAEAWKSYHKWAMDQCDLKLKYFVAMRQQCMLGTSPIYLPWRKTVRQEFRSRRKEGKIVQTKQEIELFNGPDFIVRDLFRWYAFNPKKSDLEDGCFEIQACSPFELQDLRRRGLLANYDDIVSGGVANAYLMEEFSRDVMRAEAMGIQIQYNTAYAGEAVIKREDDANATEDRTFMKTTIWSDMIFPEACQEGEDPEKPIPMRVDLYSNSICGLIQRNPFYHQRPPYVVGKYILPNADEYYGQGIPWATQFIQYEMNSKAEQGMDSATLAMNPIAIINPGLAGASNEFNVEPGAIWFADPAGVKLASMPDQTPIAYQAISTLKALAQDYSDRSPALPPQLMGKSRTATQSEMVFDSLGVDNWLFQLQNESLILTPTLQQWEAITDQNMTDDMLIMILGRRAGDFKRTLLTREDLLGRYAYQWKGASASAAKQVVSRQMLDALKVITGLPPGALQGLNFNYGEFIKILWTDMWNLDDADKILGAPEVLSTQDADAEDKMVKMGLEIEVLPNDDDQEHIRVHDLALKDTKNKSIQTLLMTHILEHKKQDEQKQAAKLAAQQQQQMQMMMLQQQQGQGGGKKPGNRTQLSPNASPGAMASGVRG